MISGAGAVRFLRRLSLVGIRRQRQRDREHAGVALGPVLDIELVEHLEFSANGDLPLT
jgi:hypothetical protein